MTIKNVQALGVGQEGLVPQQVLIETDNSLEEVLSIGFLDLYGLTFGYTFSPGNILFITMQQTAGAQLTVGTFGLQRTNNKWQIIPLTGAGQVQLPTIAGRLASFKDTLGTIGEDSNPSVVNGEIQAGINGSGHGFTSYAPTANAGTLRVVAANNSGNFSATITNAALPQTTTFTIPDPGVGSAQFLLNTGSASIKTMQRFIGLNAIIYTADTPSTTWTPTRVNDGDYTLVRAPILGQSLVAFDVTPDIQLAANKGFRLQSYDVIYSIGTASLNSLVADLQLTVYANNTAPNVTLVPVTQSLPLAVQAQPYLSNVSITTPQFLNTGDSKYVIEVDLGAPATAEFAIYGIMLRFQQSIA